MFRRLLIANRGEISLRIARTCRRLGVETVAVFSEADRDAPWLDAADERLCIGPARAAASYLDADAILQAAEQSGCQALHPGYGFLSESASFAARCAQQGVTFVGPPPGTIRRMGDKAVAKQTMRDAGVPTIPGSEGVVSSAREAREVAGRIGLPVLLKAAAGGGGKGMRVCREASELDAAYAEATLEADKAFGDARLYVEKLIEGGRHIEFQLLADGFGHAVHLGERECSIQRKHQKLIEESPSPAVDREMRDATGRLVAQAAVAMGYRSAGTVEFLRAPGGALYFMEMNTRLQVEHPVTEMLTGVDIVEQQLFIAANRRLEIEQASVALDGHAIEFRINAEDPEDAFRPTPGTIERFVPPGLPAEDEARVRWDSAIVAGYRIPAHYDSMIGKLIVHAADRSAALRAGARALDSLVIEGVRTTRDLHRRILEHPDFQRGRYDVHFLERTLLREPAG